MSSDSQRGELLSWQHEAEQALEAREFRLAHELCLRILTQAPAHADAFFLLAMIAAAHDNYSKAVDVIGRAIRLKPARAEYHAQLGRCLIALNRPQAALAAAQRALALAPEQALTWDTIGVVMTRAGSHAEAVEPFRQAVARGPQNAAFQYNLAAALQFVGEFAQSAAAYREALRLDPTVHRAWSSLAQVTSQPFTSQELAALHAALDQASDADARLHLCHALAKQAEDAGEFARAFNYLALGKQSKRAVLNYQRSADDALFAAVRAVCTGEFCASSAPGALCKEPIFIVGMPRTGTTLLERILTSHPQVYSAGELTNFALVVKRTAGTASTLVLDPDTLRAARTLDFKAVGEAYIESTRPRTGHTARFVDKMPLNFFYAGFIRRALPNAKILCLRRNALDSCLSNYRQLFATQFPYYNYAYDLLDTGHYCAQFERLLAHWRDVLPGSYTEVHYEQLVADTEAEARRVLQFCGLPWDAACLQFHANSAPVATASSVQVRQPIYRSSLQRWRRYGAQVEPLKQLLSSEGVELPD